MSNLNYLFWTTPLVVGFLGFPTILDAGGRETYSEINLVDMSASDRVWAFLRDVSETCLSKDYEQTKEQVQSCVFDSSIYWRLYLKEGQASKAACHYSLYMNPEGVDWGKDSDCSYSCAEDGPIEVIVDGIDLSNWRLPSGCAHWLSYSYEEDVFFGGGAGPYPQGPYSPFTAVELERLREILSYLEAYDRLELDLSFLEVKQPEPFDLEHHVKSVILKIERFEALRQYVKQRDEQAGALLPTLRMVRTKAQSLQKIALSQRSFLSRLPAPAPVKSSEIKWQEFERLTQEHFFSETPVLVRDGGFSDFSLWRTCSMGTPNYYPSFKNAVDALAWYGEYLDISGAFSTAEGGHPVELLVIPAQQAQRVKVSSSWVAANGYSCDGYYGDVVVRHKELGSPHWTEEIRAEAAIVVPEILTVLEAVVSATERMEKIIVKGVAEEELDAAAYKIEEVAQPIRRALDESINEEFSSLERLRTSQSKRENEHLELKDSLAQAKMQITDATRTLEKLVLEFDKSSAMLTELQIEERELRDKSTSLREAAADAKQIEEYEKLRSEIKAIDDQITSNNRRIASVEVDISLLEVKLQERTLFIEEAKNHLSLVSERIMSSENLLHDLERKIKDVENELNAKQGTVTQLSLHLSQIEQ